MRRDLPDIGQKIKTYREEIDRIDEQLLRLLNERAERAQKIGELKGDGGQEIYKPEREREIISRLREKNKGKAFPSSALDAVYGEIISAIRSLERDLKVGYLGPEGSYTHLACIKQFGTSTQSHAITSIDDIFKEVELGQLDYGVVPVENSHGGIVHYTLDKFIYSDLKICAERYMNIEHCLLSNTGELGKIKRIYGHSQSFTQCRIWLNNNLPNVEKIETSSNSKGVSLVEWDKYSAGIGSEVAGKVYGVEVLERGIQDTKSNVTRFLIIGTGEQYKEAREGGHKTSLICTISDKVGALGDILEPFSKRRINLTKIESRPSGLKAWDYIFFIDIEGSSGSQNIIESIKEVESECLKVKQIGSYPKGEYPKK